jgi:hypothetical protein
VASSHLIRRLAKSMQARTDAIPTLAVRFGTVATVTAGAATDGAAAITVEVLGTTQQMPYLASYTPAEGDTVLVLSVLRYPVVLGRVAGLPSF